MKISHNELKSYLSKIPDEALYAYNVYQIEGEGRSLFSDIKGDEETIMGLPIKQIKDYLKEIKWKIFSNRNPIEHSLSPKLHNFGLKLIISMQFMKNLMKTSLLTLFLKLKRKIFMGLMLQFLLKKQ